MDEKRKLEIIRVSKYLFLPWTMSEESTSIMTLICGNGSDRREKSKTDRLHRKTGSQRSRSLFGPSWACTFFHRHFIIFVGKYKLSADQGDKIEENARYEAMQADLLMTSKIPL